MRLGRIPWVNAEPVQGGLDRGIIPLEAEAVSATAAELNDLLAAGALDVSVISAVEYARNAAAYVLLPGLAIGSAGPVHSVALFSHRPVEALDGATVLTSASSRTSVLLLQLLCRHRWGIAPQFATARAEPSDLPELDALPHDAVLVIGDAALHLRAAGRYPHMVDLGEAWHEWTGLPFVFAVWAARRDADPDGARAVHRALIASREWGMRHLDRLASEAAGRTGFPVPTVRDYLGRLDYDLTPAHLEGLSAFLNRLTGDRLVPDGTLSFLTAA